VEAKRIEVLMVNKVAALVDIKGKAALAELRERGSDGQVRPQQVCV
jgi:hypothetical protein